MPMKNPPHPGEILRHDCIGDMTIKEVSELLNVSRNAVHEILSARTGVTPQMAMRLSKAFKTTPEFWLNLQRAVNLYNAQREIKKLPRALKKTGTD